MAKWQKTLVALAVSCAAITAHAGELNVEEASELRSRADGLLAERQRNPGWDGGTTRLAQRGDVRLNQNQRDVKMRQQGDVKTKPKSGEMSKTQAVTKKAKRTAADLPGAFVRKH